MKEKAPEAKDDITEMGPPFIYKGYEATVVKREENDRSPAWSNIDAKTGKRIILVVEGVPEKLLEPLLEHEIYEIEHGFNHQRAKEVGRKKAEELGISEEFIKFEEYWEDTKERLELEEKHNGERVSN